MARLRYALSALRDLTTIRLNVAETNGSERRADAVIERIAKQCAMLKAFPHMGRTRPEFQPAGLRSFPVRPNVVFFKPDENDELVHILRIIDGRRDLQTIFSGEELIYEL